MHVTDIAGLVRGAAEGAGLGNAFLSNIKPWTASFRVVRAFESEEVIHVDDSVDPVRDLETIQHELYAKDMEYLRRAVDQEKLDVKKNPTMKLSGLFVETMDKVEAMLGSDLPIRGGTWTTPEVEMIKEKLPQAHHHEAHRVPGEPQQEGFRAQAQQVAGEDPRVDKSLRRGS